MWRGLLVLPVCGLFACSGSLTAQPAQPNYTLNNVDPGCVRGLILNSLIDQGFTVRSSTDNQIVAGRPALGGGVLGALAPTNERRVTILFIPLPDSAMRVVVSESLVDNAGSGFERVTPVYPGNGQYSSIGQNTQAQCARR